MGLLLCCKTNNDPHPITNRTVRVCLFNNVIVNEYTRLLTRECKRWMEEMKRWRWSGDNEARKGGREEGMGERLLMLWVTLCVCVIVLVVVVVVC